MATALTDSVLHRYYLALDGAELERAAAAFSDDAVYAVPQAGVIETAERLVLRGRAAILEWFRQREQSPIVHEPSICLAANGMLLVEGLLVPRTGGSAAGAYMATAQLDEGGLIRRYTAWAGRPPAAPRAGVDTGADAAEVIDRYFHHLEVGEFEAAVACFSENCEYSHPPYKHTGITNPDRVVFHGHEQLLAAFQKRGVQSFRHRIVTRVQVGGVCLFDGEVVGLPNGSAGAFVSSATLDGDGRIARYISFYCEPAPR